MKKRTFLLFGLLAMLVLTACGGKSGAQTSTDDATDTSDNSQQTTAEETAQPIGQHHAQITIKDTARLTSSWTAMQRLSRFRTLWTWQTTVFTTD